MQTEIATRGGIGSSLASADPTIVLAGAGLTKVYHMGEVDVHALRGVDLRLPEGQMTVLLGASGSGKSTLLNILGGLDVATAGRPGALRTADRAET